MKSIAVITDSAFKSGRPSTVGPTIRSNILAVFGGQVTVTCYCIDALSAGTEISEDLIIVMAGSRVVKIRNHVASQENIIVAKRTFSRSSIYPLFNIPNGTDVLVVNDDIETVLESISSLYHIGVKHVNLIPFEAGKEYRHIRHVVCPSELELVPDYIPHVYDVGSRVVDITTMLLIGSMLHISDKQTQQNLYTYHQEILSPNEGIIENYNSLMTRTEELDLLLDLSHDGILLTDREGMVIICNRRFKEMFTLSGKLEGRYLHDILQDANIQQCYSMDFHDDLLTIDKKIINLEKRDVLHFNQEVRMYFSFQEVTHIKKLEQNLSQKLRRKGQIARYTFDDIICSSKEMRIIIDKAEKIARTDLTVLITGESGTGKEILAQAIHNASDRHNQPFIAVNSAAIPDNLIESELFGYVSGSFTGALKGGKQGLFERANNGTVFLDEIGDMPNHLQSKLLRVLQERQITPIGSDRIIDIDIRVIAATHKSPSEMIASGIFRKDLFYRLNVFPLELPALRRRKEDIPVLLQAFTGNRFTFSEECMSLLMQYDWPGNIRELNNVGQYISTVEESDAVGLRSLPYYLVSKLSASGEPVAAAAAGTVPAEYLDAGTGAVSASAAQFEDERLILEQKTDSAIAVSVLRGIELLNRIGKTAGRKHLLELLGDGGWQAAENRIFAESRLLTEGRLRTILDVLQGIGLIRVEKGRSGSYLTEKGSLFLAVLQVDKQVN